MRVKQQLVHSPSCAGKRVAPVRREPAESGDEAAAIQLMGFGDRVAALIQSREHQARSIPGHIGMVPFHPGGGFAVWAPGWLHIKIRTGGKHAWPALSIQANKCQNVAPFVRMHKQNAVLRGRS